MSVRVAFEELMQFQRGLRDTGEVQEVSGPLNDGPLKGIAKWCHFPGIELGTKVSEDGQNIVETAACLRIAEKIEKRQFDRRNFHFAGIGLMVLDARGNGVQVLFEIEGDFRPASLDVPHLLVGDDLEFHDRMMRGTMKLGGFQQADIIGPFLMAHQVVDEGRWRRTAEIKVLGRYDNVEALPRVQEPSALLQFLSSREESPPACSDGRLCFVGRKNQAASREEPCDIGGQAGSRYVWIIIHSQL